MDAELTRQERERLLQVHCRSTGWEYLRERFTDERKCGFPCEEYIALAQKGHARYCQEKLGWCHDLLHRLGLPSQNQYEWQVDLDFRRVSIRPIPTEDSRPKGQSASEAHQDGARRTLRVNAMDGDIARRLMEKRDALSDHIRTLLSRNRDASVKEIDSFVERLGGAIRDMQRWFPALAEEYQWELPDNGDYAWGVEATNQLFLVMHPRGARTCCPGEGE